jgi:hypothetical protein
VADIGVVGGYRNPYDRFTLGSAPIRTRDFNGDFVETWLGRTQNNHLRMIVSGCF